MEKNKRIDSLQALRALSFFGIFLLHSLRGFIILNTFLLKTGFVYSMAELGVSIFFVMSGFLMSYNHPTNNREELFIKNSVKNAINKIKSLYPLHIITMIFAIILYLLRKHFIFSKVIIKELIRNTILNVLLLQTWVPNDTVNVSLNGVAWFLSVVLFLYFMFPYINNFVKNKKISTLCIISILLLMVQVISCYIMIKIFGAKSHVYSWFMYTFPIFRLVDFFVGCVALKIYKNINTKNITARKGTLYEVVAVILTAAVFVYYAIDHKRSIFIATSNWTTMYIPIAAIWVLLFSIKKGHITRLLSNKLLITIGNISSYLFLIHYVITQYTGFLINTYKIKFNALSIIVVVILQLLITIGLSYGYKAVHKKILTKREK